MIENTHCTAPLYIDHVPICRSHAVSVVEARPRRLHIEVPSVSSPNWGPAEAAPFVIYLSRDLHPLLDQKIYRQMTRDHIPPANTELPDSLLGDIETPQHLNCHVSICLVLVEVAPAHKSP